MQIRVGYQAQPQHAEYPAMRDAWRRAEDAGVDVVFNWDHFFPLYGDPDGMHLECWTLLGAMAEVTERVEIGALVTCNTYRNPELLADMARTVDQISGGRLILGIGAGWNQKDHDEFGFEFGDAPDRLRRLRASMPRIKARLAKVNPQPVRTPIPILIGGGGEKVTLRIVAEHADIWNGFGDPEQARHKLEILRGHCDKVGRDFDAIEKSIQIGDDAQADRLDEYVAAGVTFFTTGSGGPDYDLTRVRKLLAFRDAHNGS